VQRFRRAGRNRGTAEAGMRLAQSLAEKYVVRGQGPPAGSFASRNASVPHSRTAGNTSPPPAVGCCSPEPQKHCPEPLSNAADRSAGRQPKPLVLDGMCASAGSASYCCLCGLLAQPPSSVEQDRCWVRSQRAPSAMRRVASRKTSTSAKVL
jgi:hypothetical protein